MVSVRFSTPFRESRIPEQILVVWFGRFCSARLQAGIVVSGGFSSATADERYEVLHTQNRQAEACPTGINLWLACRLRRRLPRGCSTSSCNPSPCGWR
jgi:hypothetical protein